MTNDEDYKDILLKIYTGPWCTSCQKPALKKTIESIEKSFVFGIFNWERNNYPTKEDVPLGEKIPRIEITRRSTGNVLIKLEGANEIIQGLEMALEDYVD